MIDYPGGSKQPTAEVPAAITKIVDKVSKLYPGGRDEHQSQVLADERFIRARESAK